MTADARLREAIDVLIQVADSDATALLLGETGTGKELLARAVHDKSSRRHGKIVTVNCAAVVEALQESEFFGHVRGAFTGAAERSIGWLERAEGGTIFLDEASEMSPRLQAQLLRVLQSGEYHPARTSARERLARCFYVPLTTGRLESCFRRYFGRLEVQLLLQRSQFPRVDDEAWTHGPVSP